MLADQELSEEAKTVMARLLMRRTTPSTWTFGEVLQKSIRKQRSQSAGRHVMES
jgi:hypothetical protein